MTQKVFNMVTYLRSVDMWGTMAVVPPCTHQTKWLPLPSSLYASSQGNGRCFELLWVYLYCFDLPGVFLGWIKVLKVVFHVMSEWWVRLHSVWLVFKAASQCYISYSGHGPEHHTLKNKKTILKTLWGSLCGGGGLVFTFFTFKASSWGHVGVIVTHLTADISS